MAGSVTAPSAGRARRGLRLILGLFAIALVAGGVWVGVGFLTLASEQAHQRYPLAGDRLVIDAEAGAVRISAGRPGVIEVDRHLRSSSLRGAKPAERLQGGTLTLRDGCPRSGVVIYCDSRYDLRVPPGLGLRVGNRSGGVRASGLTGPLDLRGDSGGIAVDGAAGALRLHTSDAAISATNLRSTDVQASTSSAGITLGFLAAPARVEARTSDASVRVTVPAGSGPYNVQQHSGDGRASIAVPTDPAAARTLVLRTSSGSITVRPAGG